MLLNKNKKEYMAINKRDNTKCEIRISTVKVEQIQKFISQGSVVTDNGNLDTNQQAPWNSECGLRETNQNIKTISLETETYQNNIFANCIMYLPIIMSYI